MLTSCTNATETFSCPECRLQFTEQPSLEAHQRDSLHAHCYNCDVASSTRQLHAAHMQSHSPIWATNPSVATQFRCCDCERDFKDDVALANHLRCSKVHKSKTGGNEKRRKSKQKDKQSKQFEKGGVGFKCKKCDKTFQSQHALGQHLTSMRHNPLSDIQCLADTNCKKRFNCPSGQLQHLESGKCVSGMTRAKLNAAVAANDTAKIITGGDGAVHWSPDTLSVASTSPSQVGSPILTPTSTEFSGSYPPSTVHTPPPTLPTSTSFPSMLISMPIIRKGFHRCPLCPPSCTREFKPSGLRHHLLSSIHAQVSEHLFPPTPTGISFHCPRSLVEGESEKAVKQFSTVSSLAQHLESGACAGGKGALECVIEYVQKEMAKIGLGALKLLK